MLVVHACLQHRLRQPGAHVPIVASRCHVERGFVKRAYVFSQGDRAAGIHHLMMLHCRWLQPRAPWISPASHAQLYHPPLLPSVDYICTEL